jgi:hypothetical protein
MKKLGTLLVVLAAVLFWVAPSFAAKEALNEDELDSVTAAGQPKVIQAIASTSAAATISFTDALSAHLALGESAQSNVSALIVNNIVGENQVATVMNIASDTNGVAGSTQQNLINQSWGSMKDLELLEGGSGGAGQRVTGAFDKCVFGPCFRSGSRGSGGQDRIRTAFADVIIHAAGAAAFVDVLETPELELNLGGGATAGTGAQENLAALIVNNVVGRNLVANALNIASGAISLATDPIISGSTTQGIEAAQRNWISQFRGAPRGWDLR